MTYRARSTGRRARREAHKLRLTEEATAVAVAKLERRIRQEVYRDVRATEARDTFDQVRSVRGRNHDGTLREDIELGLVPAAREKVIRYTEVVPGAYAAFEVRLEFEAVQYAFSPSRHMTVRWWGWRCKNGGGKVGAIDAVVQKVRYLEDFMEPIAQGSSYFGPAAAQHVRTVLREVRETMNGADA